MSLASQSAHVRIMLADYALADPQGKLNIIGGGISIVGINGETGATVPFAVVARISFGADRAGESPAIELLLENTKGETVAIPGPIPGGRAPQYLRVGLSERLNSPHPPLGANLHDVTMRPSQQLIMYFANGLPLQMGQLYRWRVRVDGNSRDEWTEEMMIPSALAGPTIG